MPQDPNASPFAGLADSVDGIGKLFLEVPKLQYLRAQSDKTNQETEALRTKAASQGQVNEILSAAAADPKTFMANWGRIAQNYVQGGGDLKNVGDIFRAIGNMVPGQTDATRMNLALSAGQAVGPDASFSEAGQNRIAGRNNALAIQKARSVPTEISAGGTLFDPLKNQVMAQGTPTESTAKAAAFNRLPAAAQESVAMSGATPRNYLAPGGMKGITLDGVTDSQTGQRLPQGATVFTGQVQSADVRGLTDSQAGTVLTSQGAIKAAADNARRLFEFAQDPKNTGLVGVLRGAGQDVSLQAQSLADYFGGDLTKINASLQQKLGDLGQKDPALVEIPARERMFMYQVASAIAGQQGRGASDQDIKNVERAFGGNGFFTSGPEFQTKLKTGLDLLSNQYGINKDLLKGIMPEATFDTPAGGLEAPAAAPATPGMVQPAGPTHRYNPATGQLEPVQ